MKKALKATLIILSILCMLLVMAVAGASDVGNIPPGQALTEGVLAMAGCVGCAWGAERIERRE